MKKKSVILAGIMMSIGIISCHNVIFDKKVNQISNKSNKLEINKITAIISITGTAEFPDNNSSSIINNSSFSSKATLTEIASQATVSLIYPPDYSVASFRNATVATGLTNSTGQFTLNPDDAFLPQSGDVFILEANKRTGGAGNFAMTVRTNIRWTGSTWESITYPEILINTKTTAISIIANLNPAAISANGTIKTMQIVNGLSQVTDINSNITADNINSVKILIEQILENNVDPVGSIVLSNNKYIFNDSIKPIPTPVPTLNPYLESRRIVFTSYRDGNDEIYIMNLDGSNQINLSNNSGRDTEPVWSPDGNKILYCSDQEIYTMSPDGSDKTRLTNNSANDYNAKWSADGTKIFFISTRDNVKDQSGYDLPQIYVMNSDGTNQTRLSNNNFGDYEPTCSPDGTKIAFLSTRDNGNYEIYVMNTDGTNQTRLTNNTKSESKPIWFTDSSKVLFDIGTIYSVNTDASNLTGILGNKHGFSQALSYDGNKLAFVSFRDNNHEIYTSNIDGSNQTRLTFNYTSPDSNPIWSKDNSRIIFLSNFADLNYSNEIYIINADGTNQIRLTNNNSNDSEPNIN